MVVETKDKKNVLHYATVCCLRGPQISERSESPIILFDMLSGRSPFKINKSRWSRIFTHTFVTYGTIGLILNSILFNRIFDRFIENSDLADIWGLLKLISTYTQTDGHARNTKPPKAPKATIAPKFNFASFVSLRSGLSTDIVILGLYDVVDGKVGVGDGGGSVNGSNLIQRGRALLHCPDDRQVITRGPSKR
ncbi:hypothetical protein FF38_04868 [Lucilia cuprina]|uniref:Uncharacterized protein n=1 Tax=Lucilia cuprina TaxID=7375 RepID=A0A0L0C8A3_LUCCU|nr:hypothetical protein FF38_04868 [Lucilia cuprina]